ncbi:glutathione S-transferase class-mu 26 kDa isozyme 47-like [Argopecten irradians]|uniref:glutathione S-transferase class-mu 26 kDa isozyme 47-like n=1 Tax=Argopecten irradians TaxID=31199 RepID=UPI003720DD42
MPSRLGYWKIRGLAQPIRLLLTYAGEDFEDILYEQGDGGGCGAMVADLFRYPDILPLVALNLQEEDGGDCGRLFKPSISRRSEGGDGGRLVKEEDGGDSGRLVKEEDGGDGGRLVKEEMGATVADLFRYPYILPLALNLQEEDGGDGGRLVQCMENAMDFRNGTVRLCYNPDYDNLKDAYFERLMKVVFPGFEKFLGDKSWFAHGEEVTACDFPMYELLDQHLLMKPGCLDEFPKLTAFHKRFAELPKIKAYLENPSYKPMPVNNKVAKFR